MADLSNIPQQHDYDSALMFFQDYLSLNGPTDNQTYKEIIKGVIKRQDKRLNFDVSSLRAQNPSYAKNLLMNPIDYFPALEHAVNLVAQDENSRLGVSNSLNRGSIDPQNQLRLGLTGSFGELHTSPRFLNASFLSHMVVLDGIVTSCSLVRPKLLKSVHFESKSKRFFARDYRDNTMIAPGNELPGSNAIPKEDADRNPLVMSYGHSVYRDTQTITIQEMPERSPPGQLPRAIDILLEDDLVDQVKPGDRVSITGIYRAIGSAFNGVVPATFRAIVIANNISFINHHSSSAAGNSDVSINANDIKNFKKISKRKDLFDLMSRSLAPSIYGHEYIKKAILLMLFGGVEKNLENGTHLRGDINILMVGDPSTAKSQLLRFVMNLAPLAVATTGRGSSGVGLTAAVVSDKETGERRLEAGAMVLADRGIVLIDEFDKMSDMDRVAIHEVMEQQTVTIAKAGIHATLNARCSVLAAANPVYGQYREHMSPQDNIRLPDSLISRFDLLFIVLDHMDAGRDRAIASHVLRTHRYLPPGVEEGTPLDESYVRKLEEKTAPEGENSENHETPVFQKYSQYLRAGLADQDDDDEEENFSEKEFLSVQFMKKYLHYSRKRVTPGLSEDASRVIAEAYAEFRQKRENEDEDAVREDKTFPVTPRTLETLIRLATAHAKIRMAHIVTKRDAFVARDLVEFCLYKKITAKPGRKAIKRRRVKKSEDGDIVGSGSEDEEDLMEDVAEEEAVDDFSVSKKESLRRSNKKDTDTQETIVAALMEQDIDDEKEDGQAITNDENVRPVTSELASMLSPKVMEAILTVQGEIDSITIPFHDILVALRRESVEISQRELIYVLKRLQDENKVMLKEDEELLYIV